MLVQRRWDREVREMARSMQNGLDRDTSSGLGLGFSVRNGSSDGIVRSVLFQLAVG
jgi:hypothetical protein